MKLEPTEAQRKAMAEATEAWNWYSCGPERRLDMVDDMIAAANIPEGPPVGTIARRPGGRWIADRATPTDWRYTPLQRSHTWPKPNEADSWPVIYDPTKPEYPHVDGPQVWISPDCFADYDERIINWRNRNYYRPRGASNEVDPEVIAEVESLGLDPTAQQEPVEIPGFECPCCRLNFTEDSPRVEVCELCVASHPITLRGQEPESGDDCRNCDGRRCMGCVFREYDHDCADDCPDCCTPPRTPRVVDRLGVDEQGSRWRDRDGDKWRYQANKGWQYTDEGKWVDQYMQASILEGDGPYTEILEPRVLPTLDCEEARDGSVWTDSQGVLDWHYRFRGVWESFSVYGSRTWVPLRALNHLKLHGPYTEVLGDPS